MNLPLFVGIALLSLVVWLGLSPRMIRRFYESKLFGPREPGSCVPTTSYPGVRNYEVSIPANDGTALRGWLFLNPASPRIFLLNLGRASYIAKSLDLVTLLLDSGASVFTYEYRGFGCSTATPSLRSICEDGVAAYDYLVHYLGYGPENLVLFGESLGTGVTTYIASQRDAAAIVLHSGFSSLERISKETVPFLRLYPSWLFPARRLDNKQILKRPHPPLLLVHGKLDDIVPVDHSVELYEAAAEPKELVHLPNSDHMQHSAGDAELFKRKLSSFLSRLA